MGTDIHGVFQKKTADGWKSVASNYYEDRHYALFAWLGDVRNGFGFAGVPTHDRIEPLSACRGFPEGFDVIDGEDHPIESNSIRGRRADWYTEEDAETLGKGEQITMWMGDHSHSWVNGDEVLSATPPSILRTGLVDIDTFKKWDGESSPDSWCGGISGPQVSIAGSPSEVTAKTTYVRIEWFEDTKESFADFVDEVRRLQDEHGEVRFVFGFDS